MELALSAFTTAFPDYVVTLSTNPDRSLLLVLRGQENSVIKRVIPNGEYQSHGHLEKWIGAIRRELIAQQSTLPLQSLVGYNRALSAVAVPRRASL
ncbi:DUF3509 domain-containing protein [Pseudomonas sp. RIT-PI-AD]|uniref:DUF3509 domain-containing protein n=1 Tax=Pseudomonas sp. RIT-PI-AD TaxID=3035294 RepID=UPI0021DB77C0|nr:DUF3509 domain-containing protein [Pseudomonas sp. RIT-PI-AD]